MIEETLNKLKRLELEGSILEDQLKWSSIPSYLYFSALSGLIWAMTNVPELSFANYGKIFVTSFLLAKIFWMIFITRITNNPILGSDLLKTFSTFSENLKRDSALDILFEIIIIYLLFVLDIVESSPRIYFIFILAIDVLLFMHLKLYFPGDYLRKKGEEYDSYTQRFHNWARIVTVFTGVGIVLFDIYLTYIFIKAIENLDSNVFKVLLLVTASFLLTKFYLRGSYYLTALNNNKEKRIELLGK